MKLTADYHTHTVYSDGKNTFLENFRRAKELGLREIGCTEHGFSHVFRGLKRRELPQYIRELREAERETVFRLTFPAFTAGLEGEEPDCYFQAEIGGADAWTVLEETLDELAGLT